MQGTSTSCVDFDWLQEDELVVPRAEAKLLWGMPLIITLIHGPLGSAALRIVRNESLQLLCIVSRQFML